MSSTQRQDPATTPAAPSADRRAGSREVVRKLLAERTEMLVLYCRLAGLEPYHNRNRGDAQLMLQEFCQVLVDYIAAGHFSLYERIVGNNERRRELAALAARLYPRIEDTTEAALAFNDKYDSDANFALSASFHDELSRLGEQIAARIEIEDQLLKLLS